jgi:hypothetical protein
MRPKNWLLVALLGLAGTRLALSCSRSVEDEPTTADEDDSETTPAPASAARASAAPPSAAPPPFVSAGSPPSSSATGAPEIDRAVERRLTIAQGLYGQTTSQDDIGVNPARYFPMPLDIFSPKGDGPALVTAKSDSRGFYEIALEPGAYRACTSFKRCTRFTIERGKCVRLDYEFSVGPGWSSAKAIPCPK